MESKSIMDDLRKTIDKSPHKSLIYTGLGFLSDYLDGRPLEMEKLREPVKDSTIIIADEIDKKIAIQGTTNPSNEVLYKCMGKQMKKHLLKSVGENLEEEEEKQLKADLKQCFNTFADICDF